MAVKNAIVFLRRLPPPYFEMVRKYFNMGSFYVKVNSLSMALLFLAGQDTEEGNDFWQGIYENALYVEQQKLKRKNERDSKR